MHTDMYVHTDNKTTQKHNVSSRNYCTDRGINETVLTHADGIVVGAE